MALADYYNKVLAELNNWTGVDLESLKADSPATPNDWILNNDRIMGSPPGFLPTTDPGDRYYNNTMLFRPPSIGIVPGIPKMSSISKLTDNDKATLENISALAESGDDEESARKLAALFGTNPNKSKNGRLPAVQFYEFQPDYAQFYKYVQLLLLAVSVAMDRPSGSNSLKNRWLYKFSDDYEPGLGDRALSFWAERSSSATESFSNEYGASTIAQAQDQVRGKIQDAQYFTGWNADNDPDARVGALTGVLSMGKGAREAAGTISSGGKIVYPNDWKDSSMSKDLSLSFKFVSPYGDPGSIFEYVYKPFLCLLALALPRQTSATGYTSPFIIRVDSPAWFTCSMGAVTSFTYKKGGSEDLWSVDGFPLVIECTLSIQDLLPTMMMTRHTSVLTSNQALHLFLLNLAGTSLIDPFETGEMSAKIRAAGMAQWVDPDSYYDSVKNVISDAINRKAGEYGMQIGLFKTLSGL